MLPNNLKIKGADIRTDMSPKTLRPSSIGSVGLGHLLTHKRHRLDPLSIRTSDSPIFFLGLRLFAQQKLMRFAQTILLGLLIGLHCFSSRAVTFFETADPARNTTAPTGSLANSGWQFQGKWGAFLGTAISPNHFIAATHIGGNIGDIFLFNGVQHITTGRHVDTTSDLTIWQVTPPFRDWAPLYTTDNEIGKRFVVFGRGTKRGAAVQVGGLLGSATKGWLWGDYDGVMRWGENTVNDVVDASGNTVLGGAVLRATFDADGGSNEATLSYGDSSGAIFIQDGSTWKLAGLNYGVDGPYNTGPTGAGFFACIFDEGGLYKGGENKWIPTPDLPGNQPAHLYITRVSIRAAWIRGIIGDPGLPSATPILEYSTSLNAAFIEDTAATFDPANMLIRTFNSNQQRFFRIRATTPIEITSLTREGSDLVIRCRYQ